MSSLSILAAAQMPAALPLRRALYCLAAGCLLHVAIGLWMLLGTGLAPKDSRVLNVLLLLGIDLAINMLAFGISCLVVREQRARRMLAASHAELLATQALLAGTVRASERLRIARDLHDIVGHHLTALSLHLDLAVRQNAAAPSDALHTARELARTLLAEVRVVVAQEREGEPIDLRAVLTTLCEGIPHPPVTLQFEERLEIDSPALAHAVFCCVRESLSNALRHADASAIAVSVGQRDGQLQVRIADDGRGGAGADVGSGLAGMRERADALGGAMAAASLPGRGYAVNLALPLAGAAR
ncbi:MAG: histidine kinase, partial [Pseudomonadota bacterium]|nr:histidine kinase [Pseudomonadota bacterium]